MREVFQGMQFATIQGHIIQVFAFLDEFGQFGSKLSDRYLVEAEFVDFVGFPVLTNPFFQFLRC